MKILIDVMSGDNAPGEILRGAADAARAFAPAIAVVGQRTVIESVSAEEGIDLSEIEICDAPSVITMEDAALSVMREKRDSSMAVGLDMLAHGEADAFVSAGNTGALVAGATLIVRKIKGVRRAAIGAVLPFSSPLLLLDSGANLELVPSDYLQLAGLGGVYAERILGRKSPRVGLLNNGAEKTKGGADLQEAYRLLSEGEGIDFVGNVEARDLPFGVCDVIVTDGFTGNAVLKLTEGLGSFLFTKLKETMTADLASRLSAAVLKPKLKAMKKEFSASEYGGAPLIGISMPVIKAHGSSDARAIFSAVRQAIGIVSSGVIPEMARIAARSGQNDQKQ